jgi:cytochrome P450
VEIDELPQLPGLPVAGSALAMRRDPLETVMRAAKLGDVVRVVLGQGPRSITLFFFFAPSGAQEVLTSRDPRLGKSGPYWGEFTRWLGHGLLTSSGPDWMRQRRTVSPMFAHDKLQRWREIFEQEADRVADEMAAAAPGRVDLSLPSVRFALRAIGRTVFGTDDVDALAALHDGVGLGSQQMLRRAQNPLRAPFSFPTLRQVRARRGFGRSFAVVDALIAERRRWPGSDLISMMLESHDETGAPIDAEQIREQAVLFLIAGHETTAIGVAAALHQLAAYPKLQDAAAADEDVARRVFLETLRLSPPAPLTSRYVEQDIVLAGCRLPAGTPAAVAPWVTHRRPDVWVDPERFDPDRFSGDDARKRPKGAYFPFGMGPQSCIGDRFATMEATLAISSICRKIRLSAPEGPVRREVGLTVRQIGLTARAERRSG